MNRHATLLILGVVLAWGIVLLAATPAGAFHYPWDQGHDTFEPDPGDDDNDPGDDPCPPNTCCLDTRGASPVEFATGNFVYDVRLVRIEGLGPELDLTLTYNSRDNRKGLFGHGWVHQYDQRLVETTDGVGFFAICRKPNGKRERYLRNPDGSFTSPPYLFDSLTKQPDGTYRLRDHRGLVREFDTAGRLTAIVDRNGNALSITYDLAGFMTAIVDAAGRAVTLTKGGDGRVANITDPAGRVYAFTYDAVGNLIEITDPLGSETTYEYDSKSNLTGIVDARGNTQVALTYDVDGRVRTHVEGQETWTYTYSPASRRTTKRDSVGNTWTINYGNAGTVNQLTDPLGNSELYTYDANLNIVAFTDKNGRTTTSTYDTRGNRLSQTDPLGNTRSWTYEPNFSRVVSETDARGQTTSYEYDANGNLTRITDAVGGEATVAYDATGQPTSLTDPAGGTYAFSYDSHGNLIGTTDPLGNISQAVIDILGKVVSSTDASGAVTQFEYDDAERLSRVVNALGAAVTYSYDASGNVTSMTDPGGSVWTFEYDALNRLSRATDASGRFTTFSYDRRSNLASRTDARDLTITFAYDALDRLVTKTRPEDVVQTTYDAVGNLLTLVDADSSLEFAYDALNRRVESSTNAATGQPATDIQYAYDPVGNRLSMTGPAAVATTYAYDPLSRLIQLTEPSSNVFTFAYDALSRRTAAGRPEGLSTAYAYDAISRLTTLNHQGLPGDLAIAYTYDAVGNRVTATDPSGLSSYAYDTAHALINAGHPAGNPAETFAYDPSGNRTSSHLSTQYTHDATNQLLADDTFDYVYDSSGNLTQKSERSSGDTTQYEFDSENQLVRIDFPGGGFANYRYDGLGRRIEKDISGQILQFIYDGSDLVTEYAGGVLTARYTHGPGTDEVLAVDRGGAMTYYQTDAQRSLIRAVGGGSVQATVVYDSFGRIVAETGDRGGPWAFQGREYDVESGLYYYRARYYDPAVGRFLSEDPIGFVAGINRYAFVKNNPVKFTDSTGLYPGEDAVEFFPDAFGADKDFWDNYRDMRDANTIGADKYFHCKANCEAARRGPGGALESYLLSETRELFDRWVKGDPPSACNADRAANDHGRDAGRKNPNVDCRNACGKFRPPALDPRY